jgi:hypothetical protein
MYVHAKNSERRWKLSVPAITNMSMAVHQYELSPK